MKAAIAPTVQLLELLYKNTPSGEAGAPVVTKIEGVPAFPALTVKDAPDANDGVDLMLVGNLNGCPYELPAE